jgi:hypothetical protein
MKARLFLVLAAISFSNSAAKSQQDGNFLGSGRGAFPSRKYAEPVSPFIKVVDGKFYNNSGPWFRVSGPIRDISGKDILVQAEIMGVGDKWVIVKNYPHELALDNDVRISAIHSGTAKWTGKFGPDIYETWDCGTEPTPEQWKQIQDEEARAQALIEKQKAEADKAEKSKIYAAQAKAIVWLQSQATNGSASAQCSLGLHYLNGQGCETNKELAVYWLTQAAERGDAEARDKLINLPK